MWIGFQSRYPPNKNKGSPYSITERRVPELIPVLGSQPAGDVSHKPDGCYKFCCSVNRGTMAVNSLPKTVNRQRRDCDLNPGPSAPESSTLTIRLPSHPPTPYLQKKTPWEYIPLGIPIPTVAVQQIDEMKFEP